MIDKKERMEAAMTMTDEREAKVQVKNLSRSFGNLLMLDNMNLEVRKREFLCVVGLAGCGKTTSLKLLNCLIEPTKGSLLIDGGPADPRHHDLAFIFQEPSPFPWLTVRDNIAFGPEIKKLPKQEISRWVGNVTNLMGLQEFQDSCPHQLSVSPEQQMVIGRSLTVEPDLLLMGKPYRRMNIKMRLCLEDEVIRLWKGMGTAVAFITHDIEEAVYLAEHVLILTNKPATIKEGVYIDLPHPRSVAGPEFIRLRKHIIEQVKWWWQTEAYNDRQRRMVYGSAAGRSHDSVRLSGTDRT